MKKAIISAGLGAGLCLIGGWFMVGHGWTALSIAAVLFTYHYSFCNSCKKWKADIQVDGKHSGMDSFWCRSGIETNVNVNVARNERYKTSREWNEN